MQNKNIVVNVNALPAAKPETGKMKKIITPADKSFLTLMAKAFVKNILSR